MAQPGEAASMPWWVLSVSRLWCVRAVQYKSGTLSPTWNQEFWVDVSPNSGLPPSNAYLTLSMPTFGLPPSL